jgi:hypothetical protein
MEAIDRRADDRSADPRNGAPQFVRESGLADPIDAVHRNAEDLLPMAIADEGGDPLQDLIQVTRLMRQMLARATSRCEDQVSRVSR